MSKQATVRFFAELNDFLPAHRRAQPFSHEFEGTVSVKDMIESLGVPHPEVMVILANGAAVGFDYWVEAGDELRVYPASAAPAGAAWAGPEPLPRASFVLDTHLGRLAAHLRMLGFDTLYRNDYEDDELARISDEEARILLTRDLGLLKRGRVRHGYFVRETQPEAQVVELVERLNLRPQVDPFTRCARCNGTLAIVEKGAIADRLPEETRRHYDEFRQCDGCDQLYWKGSHFARLEQFLARVLEG